MLGLLFLGLFTAAGCASAPPTGGAAADPRLTFLASADRALARRDPKALAALADLEAWRKAGNPDVAELELTLPAAPLERERELSGTEVLYKDGEGRSWRMRLAKDGSGAWRLVILPRPCPPGGQRRQPLHERAVSGATGKASTWTPLECWPLPR